MATPLPRDEARPRRRRTRPVRVMPARLVPMSASDEAEAVEVMADLLLELLAEDEGGEASG